jgi:hypothetical protein
VRDEVRAAVEAGIAFLLWQRARDTQRHVLARLVRRLRGLERPLEITPAPAPAMRAAGMVMLGRAMAASVRVGA